MEIDRGRARVTTIEREREIQKEREENRVRG